MDKIEFGRYLKEKREEADLSQDALATMIGSQQQILGNWEVGRALPTGDAADKLREVAKVVGSAKRKASPGFIEAGSHKSGRLRTRQRGDTG